MDVDSNVEAITLTGSSEKTWRLDRWVARLGGTILFLAGLYLFTQGIGYKGVDDLLGQAVVAEISPVFLNWLCVLGVVIAIQGAFLVVQSVLRYPNLAVKNAVSIAGEMLNALAIPLLLWLRDRAEIIPIFSIRDGLVSVAFPQGNVAITRLRGLLTAVILLLAVGILFSIYKTLMQSDP